jgi:hypothetical protein
MPDRQSYLSRYLAGDRVAVWEELIALGDQVRVSPLLEDATAVVKETVTRAKQNIELLYGKLVAHGFQFADPDHAYVPTWSGTEESTQEEIAKIERRLGVLPLLAKAWYESIESLDFSQAQAQYFGPAGPDINGLRHGLVMWSLEKCWREYLFLRDYGEQERLRLEQDDPELAREMLSGPVEPFLPTGGDASNCERIGYTLPCPGADGVLYDDGAGDKYLVHHLRHYFECGGFPMLTYYAAGKPMLPGYGKPNWEKLLPHLRDGLIEI